MTKYDLEAIPVVNDKKELLGRITIDDIVDFIKDEAEEDYLLAAGVSSDVEADDTIWDLSKARLPWLFLGLIGGLGSVFILQNFEQIMTQPQLRNLFFYTPLLPQWLGMLSAILCYYCSGLGQRCCERIVDFSIGQGSWAQPHQWSGSFSTLDSLWNSDQSRINFKSNHRRSHDERHYCGCFDRYVCAYHSR